LVAPDGATTPAGPITIDASPRLATGQWAASNSWPDSVTGNSTLAAMSLRQVQAGAALQGQEQVLAMVSSTQIVLPDPVAYRRDWANYRVRLTFGTPPGSSSAGKVVPGSTVSRVRLTRRHRSPPGPRQRRPDRCAKPTPDAARETGRR
jgi:hypothetical protein